MFLLQAMQAPFVVHVADEQGQPKYEVHIPRYKLRDAIELGAQLTQRWRMKQTEGLSENQIRDFNTMYPEVPAMLGDIKRAVSSMEGAEEVIKVAMARATIYESIKSSAAKSQNFWKKGKDVTTPELRDRILNTILDGNGAGTLVALGWELADAVDKSEVTPPQPAKSDANDDDTADEKADKSDPLKGTGKQE